VTSDRASENVDVRQSQGAAGRRVRAPLKILFLLPFAPDLKGSHGGSRAVAAMVEMLSEHHRLWVVYLTGNGDPPPRQLPSKCERLLPLAENLPQIATRSAAKRRLRVIAEAIWREPQWVKQCWSPLLASEIAATAAEFVPDIVHFEMDVMAQYIPVIRSATPSAVCIVTEHDAGVISDGGAKPRQRLTQWLSAMATVRAWRRYVRSTLRRADAIVVFTQRDATALRRLLRSTNPPVAVIPLRLPQDARSLDRLPPAKSDFLFVGNFVHPPNVDAARRLVHCIFPAVQRELPGSSLTIVGARPPDDLVAAASSSVTVTGWVDDPSRYLAGAAVVIVPLREGGGLRVKMLDACAAGKAILASPLAVEGLSLSDGEQVMIAKTDEEFARTAVALIENSQARARLEIASRRWWEEEQDSARWYDEYAELYASLPIGGRREAR
jgi:glycosyltransferase involved in cell wall biosynthesis